MKRARIRCVKLLGSALTAEEQFTWALIAGGASNSVRNRVKIALLWHRLDADRALNVAAQLARDNPPISCGLPVAPKMEMAA